ncbi:haloacid dehalogenase type II [Sinomonas atrocyanea]|uniref:haloacid dehalogenase type II n=1 Tax=Sinomonas atrocyanea TaxID=37927 RepID=UPI002788FF6F|nr:haloacid dehalogenase type II [Sinomonas atrocyanea]MDQ0261784.1 2-haloacid dehalogenase [Sinomonas atrocyanea]MDR6623383.1 2-haloacid dehalogenase [Sinomonas atrocyanea]
MPTAPSIIVFDVNETLSDMSPMAQRFADIGAPAHLAKQWFAALLRDGFALAATGDSAGFAEVGAGILAPLLDAGGISHPGEAARRLAGSLGDLPLHADVADAVRSLRAAGYRLVTLTNGSAKVAEQLFAAAGILGAFEKLLSVEDAPNWKPHPSSYAFAAQACGARAEDMALVAVHPWDIHGAARAGLRTAWVNRDGGPYPSHFAAPDVVVSSLSELEAALR